MTTLPKLKRFRKKSISNDKWINMAQDTYEDEPGAWVIENDGTYMVWWCGDCLDSEQMAGGFQKLSAAKLAVEDLRSRYTRRII